jgi:hypothetical protein
MSYTSLQSDIAGWLNRTDLAAQIPSFIAIAESRFQLDVRAWQMLTPVTLTVLANAPSVAVPADWLEWDRLYVNGLPLDYTTPDYMQRRIQEGSTTDMHLFTMVGGNLIVGAPNPAAVSVQASYYARIPALATAASGTNWLLDTYPAVYLYGSLVGGFNYAGDDQDAAKYESGYATLVGDINSNAKKAMTSGSQWRQRARR